MNAKIDLESPDQRWLFGWISYLTNKNFHPKKPHPQKFHLQKIPRIKNALIFAKFLTFDWGFFGLKNSQIPILGIRNFLLEIFGDPEFPIPFLGISYPRKIFDLAQNEKSPSQILGSWLFLSLNVIVKNMFFIKKNSFANLILIKTIWNAL